MDLPDELLFDICDRLITPDLARMIQTNRNIHTICYPLLEERLSKARFAIGSSYTLILDSQSRVWTNELNYIEAMSSPRITKGKFVYMGLDSIIDIVFCQTWSPFLGPR